MKAYKINVVREPGPDPLAGEFYPFAHEEFLVEANSVRKAYELALVHHEIMFRGQLMRVFIDGVEFFDENY